MLLDVRACLKGIGVPFAISEKLSFSAGAGFFDISTPVSYTFKASLSGARLTLYILASGQVLASCARCLGEVKQTFSFNASYSIFEADLEDPDFELELSDAKKLDIERMVEEEIILQLPRVFICSETCEGLCQHCGMHATACSCAPTQKNTMDPRWQALKDLL